MRFDDAHYVRQSLEGDTEAFGCLVEKYQGPVYATAYHYVGRYGAAEDIAQEAFLQAYKSLRRLRDANRFGPWLKEIACRTAANWLRKNVRRMANETPLPFRRTISLEDVREGPGKGVERAELYERVQKAIDALPERYRLPIVLRYLQELSYDEISEFTGETREEIRGILQRAGRQLRSLLIVGNGDSDGDQTWLRVRT